MEFIKAIRSCSECGAVINRYPTRTNRYFCGFNCKALWQKRAKPVTKEWLEDQYLVKGLDTSEIGKIVKRDPKSVWNWLRDFKIPTRHRGGSTLPHAFKKGQVNLFQGRKHTESTKAKIRECRKESPNLPHLMGQPHYLKGKKGPLSKFWKGGITPERQSLYATAKWITTAKKVRKRDKGTCQRCGRAQSDSNTPFDIHHIVGFECKALRTDIQNLVLLCEPCHYWVHGKGNTAKDFIKPIPS